MKKNIVRIVAALLVAMLALTLFPLSAFAVDVYVDYDFFDESNPSWSYDSYIGTYDHDYISKPGNVSVTIKTSDYPSLYELFGELYDLEGIYDWTKAPTGENGWDDPIKTTSSIKFDAEYLEKYPNLAWLIYTPHQHKLSRWYSDGTTHWRECLTCKKYHISGRDKFMYQNWCQDGDEDGICNICGGDVPYHDITIEAPDGYKVTLNRDNASHRMKITADVDAPAGEQYKLHFIKVRNDGSEQEITRYKENGVFYTKMPTYPMKVVIESK